MNVIEKYQCEICDGVFDQAAHAQQCERNHIRREEIQVVRAIHSKGAKINPPEGQWPDVLIVGKDKFPDKLMRYRFEDEELWQESFGDTFYNIGGGIER